MTGFNAQNGLFFDRMETGQVKITKVKVEDTSKVEAVFVIDKNTWESVVKSMEIPETTDTGEETGSDGENSGEGDQASS